MRGPIPGPDRNATRSILLDPTINPFSQIWFLSLSVSERATGRDGVQPALALLIRDCSLGAKHSLGPHSQWNNKAARLRL